MVIANGSSLGSDRLFHGGRHRETPVESGACEKAGQWRKAMFALRDAGDSQATGAKLSGTNDSKMCPTRDKKTQNTFSCQS